MLSEHLPLSLNLLPDHGFVLEGISVALLVEGSWELIRRIEARVLRGVSGPLAGPPGVVGRGFGPSDAVMMDVAFRSRIEERLRAGSVPRDRTPRIGLAAEEQHIATRWRGRCDLVSTPLLFGMGGCGPAREWGTALSFWPTLPANVAPPPRCPGIPRRLNRRSTEDSARDFVTSRRHTTVYKAASLGEREHDGKAADSRNPPSPFTRFRGGERFRGVSLELEEPGSSSASWQHRGGDEVVGMNAHVQAWLRSKTPPVALGPQRSMLSRIRSSAGTMHPLTGTIDEVRQRPSVGRIGVSQGLDAGS
jgi:hypothetical protein